MGRDQGDGRWQKARALVQHLEPQIIEIFSRHGVEPDLAAEILEEVVTLLLYRWNEIARPESWFVEMIDQKARRGQREWTS